MTEALCVLPHRHEPERPRRAMDGLYVCAGCRDRIEQAVAELPALYAALTERLPAQWHGQPSPHDERSALAIAEKPLPINPAVAEHRDQMRRVAASWARLTSEERGLVGPATPRLGHVSAWLLRSVTWACAQPWVDDYADEVLKLAGRARALIAANPRRRFVVGDCPDRLRNADGVDIAPCPGTLTASLARGDDLLPSEVSCDIDVDHVWTADQWVALGRRIHGGTARHHRRDGAA